MCGATLAGVHPAVSRPDVLHSPLTLPAAFLPLPQLVGKRPDGSTYEFQLNHTFNANQINW